MSHAGVAQAVDEALEVAGMLSSLGGRDGHLTQFGTADVDLAGDLVDRSGIIERLETWRQEDRTDPETGEMTRAGGRPATLNARAIMVALVMLANASEPLLLTRAAVLLDKRIPSASQEALGVRIPDEGECRSHAERARRKRAVYLRVWRCIHQLLSVIDPYPAPRWKLLTTDEFEAIVAGREDEEVARKLARLEWVTNQLIEASLSKIPAKIRRQWKGSVCVDATAVGVFARGTVAKEKSQARSKDSVAHVSIEPEAGWYRRDADGRDPEDLTDAREGKQRKRSIKKLFFAYEAELLVSGPDDPGAEHAFPVLVMAMNLHKPSEGAAEGALRAAQSVAERGWPAGWFAGDLLYLPNSRPEILQNGLRKLGYEPVFDYRKDQLGYTGAHEGAKQVEGCHYCPAMPEALVTAGIDYAAGVINEETWQARTAQRERYALRAKEKKAPGETVDMVCPAYGPSPTVICSLKPTSQLPKHAGLTLITKPPARPGKICTNSTSVAFPPEATAKYGQRLRYGSDEHTATYGMLRSCVEGVNGYLKDASGKNIGQAGRRRVRGYAAQSLLLSIMVMAANLDKIRRFLAEAEARADGTLVVVNPKPALMRDKARAEALAAAAPLKT